MDTIENIMAQTGMDELQAYRHLQDRRIVQRFTLTAEGWKHRHAVERARPVVDSAQANEALRLWQIARLSAKRGEQIQARAYYRECLEVLK